MTNDIKGQDIDLEKEYDKIRDIISKAISNGEDTAYPSDFLYCLLYMMVMI